MSSYPKWWTDTITVYNKYIDPQTDIVKWYRTVLSNCFWKYEHNKAILDKAILENNYTLCRIPKDPRFLEKYEWVQVPNDKMSDYFTLSVGDIVVKGAVLDDIDEYKSGKRSSDFIKKYKDLQGCITINAVTNNSGEYRNDKHYYITGI